MEHEGCGAIKTPLIKGVKTLPNHWDLIPCVLSHITAPEEYKHHKVWEMALVAKLPQRGQDEEVLVVMGIIWEAPRKKMSQMYKR